MSKRVVILVDANDGEVIEKPDDIEVVVIPWEKIGTDPEMSVEGIQDLEAALAHGDIDKAIRITRMLTAEPPDGDDPREYGMWP